MKKTYIISYILLMMCFCINVIYSYSTLNNLLSDEVTTMWEAYKEYWTINWWLYIVMIILAVLISFVGGKIWRKNDKTD